MNKEVDVKDLFDIVVRYSIIFLAGLGNLYIFYAVLTPLTLGGVGLVLGSFYDVSFLDGGFIINGVFFNLVSACVGGAAFYLLFFLVMSCRDIGVLKRVRVFLFAFVLLYVFNVLRIVFMVKIYGGFYFYFVHWIIWYFVSTLFVVIIWFLVVWLFEIRGIPVYSDFKFVFGAFWRGRRRVKGNVGGNIGKKVVVKGKRVVWKKVVGKKVKKVGKNAIEKKSKR